MSKMVDGKGIIGLVLGMMNFFQRPGHAATSIQSCGAVENRVDLQLLSLLLLSTKAVEQTCSFIKQLKTYGGLDLNGRRKGLVNANETKQFCHSH